MWLFSAFFVACRDTCGCQFPKVEKLFDLGSWYPTLAKERIARMGHQHLWLN